MDKADMQTFKVSYKVGNITVVFENVKKEDLTKAIEAAKLILGSRYGDKYITLIKREKEAISNENKL